MSKNVNPIQRFTRRVERCSICGALNSFVVVRSKRGRGQRVDYLRCRACSAHATRVWIDG